MKLFIAGVCCLLAWSPAAPLNEAMRPAPVMMTALMIILFVLIVQEL